MALRLDKCIVQGWIDNRTRGTVKGELWLHGREYPVTLNLEGNCWRDIAGCRIDFVNPKPDEQKNMDSLFREQNGSVGDMTASRKVRCDVPETYKGRPLETNVPRVEHKPGEPVPMATCLYLEWFSQRNGRVVIETAMFNVEVDGEPAWTMTAEEEQEQSAANANALRNFIDQAYEAFDDDDAGEEPENDDEFTWEERFRESDERTEKLGELMEAYQDHPDSERIIAREMGWDKLEDLLDADERGLFEEEKKRANEEAETIPDPEPNPLTKGRDWVFDDNGKPAHPLQLRVFNFAIHLRHRYRDRGMTGEGMDDDLHDMIFQVQTLGAKLAGALNNLAYDHQPEPGLVVASLKRALQYVNDGVKAADKVAEKNLVDQSEVDEYREELFDVREEMLSLMQRFREQT